MHKYIIKAYVRFIFHLICYSQTPSTGQTEQTWNTTFMFIFNIYFYFIIKN